MSHRPVALWTADWHVKRADCIWGKRREIAGDVAFGVHQILRLAKQYDVQVVGIAGDTTNERMQFSTGIALLRHTLDVCQHSGLLVWYIQGNHDMDTPPVLQAMHSWPEHLHASVREIPGTAIQVCGLDYQYPGRVVAALENLKSVKADVLFTHQTWKDLMSDDTGHAWFEQIPPQFQTLVTGDYHKHCSGMHVGDHIRVVSPGPLCMQRLSETEPKGVYIMYDDLEVESVLLKTRGYFEEKLLDDEALMRFLDGWMDNPARVQQTGVPQWMATNILRVWYNPELPEAWKRITERVGSDVHLFKTAFTPETRAVVQAKMARLQTIIDGGIDGCIAQFYADDPSVKDDALWLWHAADPAEAARAIYKARLTEAISGETQ